MRIITILLFLLVACPTYAREQISIVGSSTVYPFSASVAEHFGKAGDFRTPVVEATGSGAGLKLFCSGIGEKFPDITNASRKILPSEKELCSQNGINNIMEIKFGFDGITLANSAKSQQFSLSRKDVFLALAREVPKDGKLVENYYHNWHDINNKLPNIPIKVYGTPPVSGTYDTFIELVMKKGCSQIAEFSKISDETLKERKCKSIREDGVFIEAGENGNLIAQKIIGDPNALGVFGFSFLEQNTGKIQGSIIDGVTPEFESIQNGSYPISRPLYFYVKGEHLKIIAGIKEYIKEFTSEAAIGDEGYLVMQGIVPLPKAEREVVRKSCLRD